MFALFALVWNGFASVSHRFGHVLNVKLLPVPVLLRLLLSSSLLILLLLACFDA